MALPAFDHLRRTYRQARITVVAAPRTKVLFEHHPDADELVVFDKAAPLRHKIDLFFRFRRAGFDVVVDLKNSFYRWGSRRVSKTRRSSVFRPGSCMSTSAICTRR